jgi:hypothetical protein
MEKVTVTTKRLNPTDQGQHGSASCGACGKTVPDDAGKCPHCAALFGEHVVEPYPGGSDF